MSLNNTRLPDDVLGLLDINDVTLTEEKEYANSLVMHEIAYSTWTATFEGTVYLRAQQFQDGPEACISRTAPSATKALDDLVDAIRKQNWEIKRA